MKVYATHDGGSGCAYWRIYTPLRELAKHGHDVEFISAGHDNSYAVELTEAIKADVVVAQRWDSPGGLGAWRRMVPFTKLVYEVDDDVFSIEPQNFTAYQIYSRAEIQDAIEAHAQAAHLITVTTPVLADVMRQFNDNVAILPNMLPGWVLDLPAPEGPRPAIGWHGGASHGVDIGIVTGALRRFLRLHPGWDSVMIGTDYRGAVKHERCGYVPWTHISDDAEGYFRSLDYDIGLAPVTDSRFNRSKSNLKALELAGRGIPVIASDVAPYRDFVVHGVTGFLIPEADKPWRTEKRWLDAMSELATDEALRLSMGAKAKELARSWLIDDGWAKWEQAYEGLMR